MAMATPTITNRSATPSFELRGLFAGRDAHTRQRDLVRASLLLRPADARVAAARRA
jgi:hypothetical protein